MGDLKIGLVYFSGTNVTHAYAQVMGEALADLGSTPRPLNVTPYSTRQAPLPIDDLDSFIFGFPVFGDFAPSVINEWLPTLDGQGKRCAQFFTYGARTAGYAHFHTKLLLEEAGFQVLFSAEFLGRHSFNVGGWRMVPDRPDGNDFAVAREYAALAVERFSADAPAAFHLQKPFGYHDTIRANEAYQPSGERGWTNPVRTAETCSMCRDCETECPTQAFDAETGLSDPMRCIECMRCVTICPDHALGIDDRMREYYEEFLAYWHLTDEMMQAKKSKIITEAWQAAF
jgi:ferredoxin